MFIKNFILQKTLIDFDKRQFNTNQKNGEKCNC